MSKFYGLYSRLYDKPRDDEPPPRDAAAVVRELQSEEDDVVTKVVRTVGLYSPAAADLLEWLFH